MSIGNSSFNLNAPAFTAAIESLGLSLGSSYRSQIEALHPAFALLATGKTGPKGESGGNFNRRDLTMGSGGKEFFVTHSLAYDTVAQINASSIGRSPSQLPTGWPTLINPTGLTRAKYQASYLDFALGFSVADLKILAGRSPDILEAKKQLALGAFMRGIAAQFNGSGPDSESALMGLGYLLSTSNTVGGIPQATNSWWQPTIDSGSGAFTYQTLNKYQKKASYKAKPDGTAAKPDLVLLSTAGSHDLALAFDNSILGQSRIIDVEFKEKFGHECTMWAGARVFADPRAPEQTVRGLCTEFLYLTGNEQPDVSEMRPLPGTNDMHVVCDAFLCFSSDFLAGHYQYTGNTA